jgi:hypothetical protein
MEPCRYSDIAVRVSVPGSPTMAYSIAGLHPGGPYAISVTGGPAPASNTTVADASGTVQFTAACGTGVTVALDLA